MQLADCPEPKGFLGPGYIWQTVVVKASPHDDSQEQPSTSGPFLSEKMDTFPGVAALTRNSDGLSLAHLC